MDQLGGLDVGTVPIFKMHNVGTVPTFKMHNVGTVPTFKMHNVVTVPSTISITYISRRHIVMET